MALVSYGASDDSDTSDTEDGRITTNSNDKIPDVTSGHISDEDDFDTVSSSAVTSTSSSIGKAGIPSGDLWLAQSKSKGTEENVNSTSVSSLEDLPAPQSKPANLEIEEEELEEEVKPKASEIASAPEPPNKKTRQPVKITVPSLQETPEEEEDDDKKKPTPSTNKSGLFSMLPAPVHSTRKEINRPLIPHSLTKKPTASSKTVKPSGVSVQSSSNNSAEVASTSDISTKHMTPFNALTGYESDSDEDEDGKGSTTNFFSLDSESEKSAKQAPTATSQRLQSEEVSSSEAGLLSVQKKTLTKETADDSDNIIDGKGDNVEEEEEEAVVQGPEPGAVNDAPLDFRSVNRLTAWSSSSYGYLAPVGPAGPVQPSHVYSSYPSTFSAPSSSMYNLASADVSEAVVETESADVTENDLKQFMSDKEFQKFQGKRKRGLEEAISFVDANVDDYVDPTEVSKHLTEETEYVSHKNKDNLPTAQQRRKKQITYLAYQAKERELELKNSWAQNRMTKKQTQSKYGF